MARSASEIGTAAWLLGGRAPLPLYPHEAPQIAGDGETRMNKSKKIVRSAIVLALAIVMGGSETGADQGIKLLAPPVDTCRAYMAAVFGNNRMTLVGFSGWFLGFLSGKAQGTGIDFLRDADQEDLNKRLYESCRAQPDEPFSSVVEEMAKTLMASHQSRQR
jgi:hypothetical protein